MPTLTTPLLGFRTMEQVQALVQARSFAGEDFEAAVVPPKARALLEQFDERSSHYEIHHAWADPSH